VAVVATETKQPVAAQPDTERIERIYAWFKANNRNLTIAGSAVLIVAAGVWFLMAARARREAFAQRELEQARASAEAGNLPLAASDLSRIVDSYGGTTAGDQANLLRGQVRLLQGQPALAVSELQQFVGKGPHAQYRAQAYALLGSALEQAKDFKSAGDAYEQAAKASLYALASGQMLLDAGRAYTVAGDTAAAERVYDRALREHTDTPIATEAKLRLGELGRFGAGS
jgi:tetratricopeptide (TPR) repeat protein